MYVSAVYMYLLYVPARAGMNTEIWLRIFVPNMPRIIEYSVLDNFRYWLALYKQMYLLTLASIQPLHSHLNHDQDTLVYIAHLHPHTTITYLLAYTVEQQLVSG